MKNYAIYLILLFVVVTLQSCNKEEDPEPVGVSASDLYGEWEITSFVMNGQNRTAELNGYTFEFFFNTDFVVNKGTIDSYGSYEVNEEAKTIIVEISNPKEPANVIEGTWEVYGKSETTLWMKSFGQNSEKEFRLTKI